MRTLRRVTAAQVKELCRQLNRGASLRRAAMRADMDRKTARKYRVLGQLPKEARKPRTWRTWPDALTEVWPAVAEQLQREPRLQAKTLWEWLQRTQTGKYPESMRRTFERRVRQWKALHGSAKQVFFRQEHAPGRLAASDFTSMNDLQVTITGAPFPHLLYHFVLTCSNWEHVTLCFAESFASLSAGMQNALWALGAVPERHRTDRMTLAVHHDGQAEQFTAKYRALLAHYGVQAEATNPYSGHENGDVESSHRHFKDAVEQALLLRGSRDFANRDEYWDLLQAVQAQRNAGRAAKVTAEMTQLRPLPAQRLETLERERVRVRRGSTIRVKKNTYSVPSRLIGEEVEARIGMEEIEVWYAEQLLQRMPRLRGQDKHQIDYRHIINWLVRKPGAFARYVYREDLYPTLTYRRAYDALVAQQPVRADKEYVRLLYLAAQEGEGRVEEALVKLLDQRKPLSEQAVRTLLGEATALSEAARVEVPPVDLSWYDTLLEGACLSTPDQGMEECHEQGCLENVDSLPARTAPAGGACPVRSSGPAGECRDLDLSGVPTGVAGARMPGAASASDRTAAEGLTAAVGEELGGPRSEASATQSGAAVACAVEWRLCGSSGERISVWTSGIGENAWPLRRGSGVGALGTADPVYDNGTAGPGIVGSQARLDSESVFETTEPLGGVAPGRFGICPTEPRGDGGAVHTIGGALRTRQRVLDEQSAVLEVGADFQRCHDDRSGNRPIGASQCDRGAERAELPGGGGQAGQEQRQLMALVSPAEEPPQRGPGSAPVAVAALRLPPLRQAPSAVRVAGSGWGTTNVAGISGSAPAMPRTGSAWGKIIVAQGER
jgi:hypothetical protein